MREVDDTRNRQRKMVSKSRERWIWGETKKTSAGIERKRGGEKENTRAQSDVRAGRGLVWR